MKIRTFLQAMGIALLAATTMTSCLSNDKKSHYTVSQSNPGYFNAIFDYDSGEPLYYGGVSYNCEWDMTASTATVKIEGLKLPNGMSYPTLTFFEVPWKTTRRGWSEVALTNAMPEGVSGFAQMPIFDKFVFSCLSRYIAGSFVPCMDIQYQVDGYTIFSMPAQIVEIGETKVINREDGSEFVQKIDSECAIYVFQLDIVKKTADIFISGAKFHKNMPAMNLKFPGVPFEVTRTGDLRLTKAELVPEMMSGSNITTSTTTPMPAFPITNVDVTFDPDKGIVVKYTCTVGQGSASGVYDVSTINMYPETASDL